MPSHNKASFTPLPSQLSEASPTTFFVNNIIWQAATNRKLGPSKDEVLPERPSYQEIVVQPPTPSFYTSLHSTPFEEDNVSLQTMALVESSPEKSLNEQDHNGNTPLIWAASQGREDVVQLLIDQGAQVNMQNFSGETALYIAAANGFVGICETLLKNGADTSVTTLEGATPLHAAAANGHISVLATLVQHGAFVNSQDEEGDSPLMWAIREGQQKAVEFLVKECKVDVELRNEDLETPLQLALCLEETGMVEFLSSLPQLRENKMEHEQEGNCMAFQEHSYLRAQY